jgi:hypothetical protein
LRRAGLWLRRRKRWSGGGRVLINVGGWINDAVIPLNRRARIVIGSNHQPGIQAV